MTKKLQLGLPYFGGKQNQAQFMESLFPTSFSKYCEPFGGTMKNFLNSDINCKDVVYNDINYYQANMMNAFKYPKTFLKAFRKQLRPGGNLYHAGLTNTVKYKGQLKNHYKQVFDKFGAYFATDKPNHAGVLARVDWEAAVMYAFCLSHSTRGIPLKSFVYAHVTYSKAKFLVVMKHLEEHIKQRKFKSVRYFTGDAMQLIKQQDSKDAFFVVDPGYVGMEHYYRNRGRKGARLKVGKKVVRCFVDEKMHVELSKTLKNVEGKFMLCYYYHPKLEKLYPRDRFTWIMKEYRRPAANASAAKRDEKGTELLILNYGEELKQRQAYRQHLIDSAKAVMPKEKGRRNRSSYSVEFKHRVILMFESKMFNKKEILDAFGIKSYNTLYKWLRDKNQIETTLVRLKEAKEYLLDLKKPTDIFSKKLTATGEKQLRGKAKNLVADLRQQSILSKKAIREIFGITNDCIEKCHREWKESKVAMPRHTKVARLRAYFHTMAA